MMTLREEDIQRFRAIAARRFGLLFEDSASERLAELLHRRLAETRSSRPADYLERIGGLRPDREELRALAGELAVGESFFFRCPDQFRVFSEVALRAILRHRPANDPVRILSAGCAAGEEAYSLAILVREAFAEAAVHDIRIAGIDMSLPLLEKARQGRYSEWSLRAVPESQRNRWFRKHGREFVLDDSIRALAVFEERNLVEEDGQFWRPGTFDIVFFRNVSIYFPRETTRAVVARIARSIVPGGFLFLGPSETLRGISHDFHLRHTHGAFYYQRLGPAEEGLASARRIPIRAVSPPAAALQAEPAPDGSWVQAICRAADKISALAKRHGQQAAWPSSAPSPSASPERPSRTARRPELEPAWELMKRERFEDALAALQALSAESAADPNALLLRAVLLTNSGKVAEAERVCRQLLDSDELDAGAHYLAALCREHAGDRLGALEHDQTAVYLDPNFALARLHLGLLARRAGDRTTARRELREALPLLDREDASRILLFGGGFSREALIQLCRAELRACGEGS